MLQEYTEKIMPMLCMHLDAFKLLADDEQCDMFPLLECITCVSLALGSGLLPYAQRIYQHGIALVEQALQQYLVRAQT